MLTQLLLLVVEFELGEALVISTVFPQEPPSAFSLDTFGRYVSLAGAGVVLHAIVGVVLLANGLLILGLSWPVDRRWFRVSALVGTIFLVLAGVGGFNFVLSGFGDNSFSYQMSTSFIIAFVFTFLTFHLLRQTTAALPTTSLS